MTKQEIFTTVVLHLRQQGKKSLRVNDYGKESCAYRGEDGTMCAVGCLIDDEHYNTVLEGGSPSSNLVVEALNASGVEYLQHEGDEIEELLRRLQCVHDDLPVDQWERELVFTAAKFELDMPPKEEA